MLQDFRLILVIVVIIHGILLGGNFLFHNHPVVSKVRSTSGVSEMNLSLVRQNEVSQSPTRPDPKKFVSRSKNSSAQKITHQETFSREKKIFISETEKETQRELFKKELRAEIEKNKFYPGLSRRLGQSGIVEVAFTLLEDGHIINVRLNRPSPFERLNQSALEAVKKVHVFRPIPQSWGEEKMDLLVSLKFMRI
jgi:TonB family protein